MFQKNNNGFKKPYNNQQPQFNNPAKFKSKFDAVRLKDMPDGEYVITLKQLNTLRNKERNKDFLEWVVEDNGSGKFFSITSSAYIPKFTDTEEYYRNTPLQGLLQAVNAEEPVRKYLGGKFVNTPEFRKRLYGNFMGKHMFVSIQGGTIAALLPVHSPVAPPQNRLPSPKDEMNDPSMNFEDQESDVNDYKLNNPFGTPRFQAPPNTRRGI